VQISGNLPVVQKQDKEPFPLADAVPQLIRFRDVLRAQIGLSHVPAKKSEIRVRHGEFRINRDGALEMRNPSGKTTGEYSSAGGAVGLQCFER
jgi:hypothetical protein